MDVEFSRNNKQYQGIVVKTVMLAVGKSKEYTPYYYVRTDKTIHFVKASDCNEVSPDQMHLRPR